MLLTSRWALFLDESFIVRAGNYGVIKSLFYPRMFRMFGLSYLVCALFSKSGVYLAVLSGELLCMLTWNKLNYWISFSCVCAFFRVLILLANLSCSSMLRNCEVFPETSGKIYSRVAKVLSQELRSWMSPRLGCFVWCWSVYEHFLTFAWL